MSTNPHQRGSSASENRESVAGQVERVTFHNVDTGFCVARLKVRSRRDLVTLVGQVPSISPGEWVQATGSWENTARHGLQFKAQQIAVSPPSSTTGVERYLGSGLIRGVGRELAKRLVEAFGDQTLDVIDNHPERLRTVEGIGPIRLERILEGWREQREIREIMVFLQSHGVGSARAVRIYKTYGSEAVALVTENPYRLATDIRGIGFRTADEIARRLGIPEDALIRARAGLTFALSEAVGKGHCALPRGELLTMAQELLGIGDELLEEALARELEDQLLVEDTIDGEAAVFLPNLWRAEREIAAGLDRLSRKRPAWSIDDVAAALAWVEARLELELADSQRDAVAAALAHKVLVITGGPGVGKTTIVNAILKILLAKRVRVALAAPTGRAARRLSESSGQPAKTIHRLLEMDPRKGGFKRGPDRPLECDLLVVDEVSMIDVPLMAALVRALPSHAALLMVGDVDQLPSVGPGQVLADLIGSGSLRVARLTEIFRQAASSRIITNAHRVNSGEMPVLDEDRSPEDTDFFFVEAADAEDGERKLVEIVARRIERRWGLDPLTDVQVLCPMNRGGLGTKSVNALLQERLNPRRHDVGEVERFGTLFRAGDKVMQTENDYDKEVFNGDIGRIVGVEAATSEVVVRFEEREVAFRFGELDQLSLAYAISIHKSQGSEYPAVVIPVTMQHFVMLQRNLIYTGMTRGRQLVILVGQTKALGLAVRGRALQRRYSKLLEHLAPDRS